MPKVMNTKWTLLLIIGVAVLLLSYITINADGATKEPGSTDDPIVTKSYVDEQIKKLTGQAPGGAGIDEAALNQAIAKEVQAALGLQVVKLEPKQILMAAAGTEFIVRTGKAIAVATDGNGIPDLTGGEDIPAQAAIPLNHLLLFPTDHRGITADPANTAEIFVMIRGAYSVIQPN